MKPCFGLIAEVKQKEMVNFLSGFQYDRANHMPMTPTLLSFTIINVFQISQHLYGSDCISTLDSANIIPWQLSTGDHSEV